MSPEEKRRYIVNRVEPFHGTQADETTGGFPWW